MILSCSRSHVCKEREGDETDPGANSGSQLQILSAAHLPLLTAAVSRLQPACNNKTETSLFQLRN